MLNDIPPEIRELGPPVAGSLTSLLFMRRPWLQAFGIFLAGCLFAILAKGWLASAMGMEKSSELVGFLIGCFGMAIVGKLFDTIEAIKGEDIGKTLVAKLRKLLGVEP